MAERYWLQLQHGFGEKMRAFKVVFESDHPGLDELIEELTLRGVVSGRKLELGNEPGDELPTVRRRWPFAFGSAGLVSIQRYQTEIREAGQ